MIVDENALRHTQKQLHEKAKWVREDSRKKGHSPDYAAALRGKARGLQEGADAIEHLLNKKMRET